MGSPLTTGRQKLMLLMFSRVLCDLGQPASGQLPRPLLWKPPWYTKSLDCEDLSPLKASTLS